MDRRRLNLAFKDYFGYDRQPPHEADEKAFLAGYRYGYEAGTRATKQEFRQKRKKRTPATGAKE